MSDHDKTEAGSHDEHEGHGAHEVDKMPSSRLFNLLFGLSALTLVACIGVVQLFYRQVDSIRDVRDTKLSFQLAEYRQEMDALKNEWSVVEMSDDDGVPEGEGGKSVHDARLYQMPLSEARKRMLEQPQQYLKASRPYRGWRNPDANAPKAAAPGAPGARPVRVPPRPQPRGAGQPGAGQPGAGQPGAGQPGAGAVPPGLVPVRPAPTGAQPAEAPTKPAEGKAPAKPAEGKAPAKPAEPAEGKAPAKPADGNE